MPVLASVIVLSLAMGIGVNTIVFSWIEWPSKAPQQAMFGRMEDMVKTDDRFNPEKNPMPFDGKRLIYGGFAPVVEL